MADTRPIVHIGENSAEEVAYKLMQHVFSVEKKVLHVNAGNGFTTADRKYLLDTYSECLEAVQGRRMRD